MVPTPTPTPNHSPTLFIVFFEANEGTTQDTPRLQQSNPPCPASATLVGPAGNSGEMLDKTCKSRQDLREDASNGAAHSISGSWSTMVLFEGVKVSFPNAVSFKILSQ